MRTTRSQQKCLHGRLAPLFVCALIAVGSLACDNAANLGSPGDGPNAGDLLNAPAPRAATPAELAFLATPAADDTPPVIERGLASQSVTLASTSSCTIRFDDYVALLILPDKAGHTFASSPYYIEGCGSGWVHVKENDVARYGSSWGSSYNHYHLMYEDGPYCIAAGGNYGIQINGSCVYVPDPATEPRSLYSHTGDQWIRIYVYKSGVAEMTFDFKSIKVESTQGIKLWFRKADGSWWHWNNLGTGTWNVAPYAAGIREILIRASANSIAPYSFDNVVVGVN